MHTHANNKDNVYGIHIQCLSKTIMHICTVHKDKVYAYMYSTRGQYLCIRVQCMGTRLCICIMHGDNVYAHL